MSIPTRSLTGNTPRRRRFKPIGAIIRTAEGKPIGRILRLLVERRIVAHDYTGIGPIGKFRTEKAAIRAIRARHEARRR